MLLVRALPLLLLVLMCLAVPNICSPVCLLLALLLFVLLLLLLLKLQPVARCCGRPGCLVLLFF
jgi:hypothetical protein